MKNYAICYNSNIKNSREIMEQIQKELGENSLSADSFDIDNLKSGYDFVFVVGGDGTILKAGRFYSKSSTPVFGINLGHLGFLSQAGECNLKKAVNSIIENKFKLEKRIMLECGNYNALNDFVIKSEFLSRASNFRLEVDSKFVCEYYADGLIISTPTGSTAYGMSAGGPILAPDTDCLTIVPICPHTFSARPIVVSSNSKIKIITKPNAKHCASADGQNEFNFENYIEIQKSKYYAILALLNNNDFYTVLRNKLNWGFTPNKCE